jgi:hypothetical protein
MKELRNKLVITEWALNSYLELKHLKVFNEEEYLKVLRPDVDLLKLRWPPQHPKFLNTKFWGPATGLGGLLIRSGFKMKWHNIGNGKVQLRLALVYYYEKVFLCQGYVKENDHKDKREMAKLKNRINDIVSGHYNVRGYL